MPFFTPFSNHAEVMNCIKSNEKCKKNTDPESSHLESESDDLTTINDRVGVENNNNNNNSNSSSSSNKNKSNSCSSRSSNDTMSICKNAMGNYCGISNSTYSYLNHPDIERYKREYSRNILLRQIIASSLGTCVSVLTLNPISVVKLRLQRQDILMETSVRAAVRTILKKDGIKGFWAGKEKYILVH